MDGRLRGGHALPGGAGLLMAAYALGGFLGGVLHGARRPAQPARVQLVAGAWLLALAILPVTAAPPPAAMVVLCMLAGTGLAPLLAVAFSVVDDVAAPGRSPRRSPGSSRCSRPAPRWARRSSAPRSTASPCGPPPSASP